jgi:predicted DNA-binding transcriptional regulator AlpA
MPWEIENSFENRAADSFVSEAELAHHWTISRRTLQRLRNGNDGPPFSIIGSSVRYRISDIQAFEARVQRNPRSS